VTDGENGMIETYSYEGKYLNEDGVKVIMELLEKVTD
tara:strand:- start:338 stop:448 length:111 start_codon:yes stop_codon:yes gene_type:complete